MTTSRKKIVIVGGGITGLSAAFYTKKLVEEQLIDVDIILIEKSGKLGGKIQTLRRDGFVIEKGPDSFLSRKTPIITLTKELGLVDELVATNPSAKTNYILHKNHLHKMPLGFILGIPTKMAPFMKTGLISPFGKFRAAMDLLLPRKKGLKDESLGDFVQRRLGKEVLEQITEPLLGGIYAGNTHTLSLKATFPNFFEMEQKHRSLIIGMVTGKKEVNPIGDTLEIAQKSMFLTYKNGMMTIVERLTEALHSIKIITNQGIEEIVQNEHGYELRLEDGSWFYTDGLIMAVPTYQTAKLLPDIPTIKWLENITYVSVANIALAFNKSDISFPLIGTGFVIPSKENKDLTACTWTSSKWLHTTPDGKVLFRCYVGRESSQEWVHLSDEELLAKVYKDLEDIMGVKATPIFQEITRALKSMPQYPVNHVEKLVALRKELQLLKPGVFLCGAGYQGVGVPDCIQQGKNAAEQMMDYISVARESI